MSGYELLLPEVFLLVGALLALFSGGKDGCGKAPAYLGALLAVAATATAALLPVGASGPFGSLLSYDEVSRLGRVAIGALTALWLLWAAGRGDGRTREAVALALLASLGAMLLSEARELITVMVSLELATLPVYVLIGYRKGKRRGLEGALKYFLLSMLTTLVTLYGFSFLFGLSGTTSYGGLGLDGKGMLGIVAGVLALVGMLAKLSAAPFHFWAPDAYESASPWAVAFVSTVPKVGGAIALVRLVDAIAPSSGELGLVVGVAAVASMVLGNLAALSQTDLRRLMAYSAVAHTGYLLLGVAAASQAGMAAAVAYAVVYAFATMGIMLVCAEEGPKLVDLGGLSQRRPAAAWAMVVLLLSLVGIPPLAGFFGKLSLFMAAVDQGQVALVVVAVVMSVVSAAYYLRVVRAAFFGEAPDKVGLRASVPASAAVALCVFAVVALGIGFGQVVAVSGFLT